MSTTTTTISSDAPEKPPWPWSGRARRSSESSVLSFRELVTGRRSSMSDGPEVRVGVLRKRPPPDVVAKARQAALAKERADVAVKVGDTPPPPPAPAAAPAAAALPRVNTKAAKLAKVAAPASCSAPAEPDHPAQNHPTSSSNAQRRKSHSRPPPAFYNKVKHRHTFSASAVLRWYTIQQDEAPPLRPPAPRSKATPSGPPAPAPAPPFVPPLAPRGALQPPRPALDGPLTRLPTPEPKPEPTSRTRRPVTKMQAVSSFPPGPPDHGPVGHGMPVGGYADGPGPGMHRHPGGYNTPRRLSHSSVSTTTSSYVSYGGDSSDARTRSASFSSSQTSVEFSPTSPGHRPLSTPVTWQAAAASQSYPWSRPAPIKQRRKAPPGELFAALPDEVLELILENLRTLHLRPGSTSCATCWMRDCCSAALGARRLLKHAREALYRDIQVVGHEGPGMKKRTKTSYGSRLVLLRRTLRANPHVAALVRSLKPPARPRSVGEVAYNDLIASVVMACPNLERLVGYYPSYDHSFQRLFQALSTRRSLKEMNWILEPSAAQRQPRTPLSPAHRDHPGGPAELEPHEAQLFHAFHASWKQLTTLVVHCHPGAGLSPANLLECTIRSLPSLQNLYLSHVPPASFGDANLACLPALKKLSLCRCPGVTAAGLSSLATRRASASIESLTLLHMNIESLPAIARIFSYLTCLSSFTLVQTYAPEMPPDELIMLFPYLASASLRRLHWDIPYLPHASTPADVILARSIAANGFPSLRHLCAPNDPEGIFQALCAPLERVELPMDRFRKGGAEKHPASYGTRPYSSGSGRPGSAASAPSVPWISSALGHTRNSSSISSTRTGGGGNGTSGNGTNGPASPLCPPPLEALLPRENSDLHQARRAAQARLEAAQRVPRYFVNVTDERGAVVEKVGVGAFLGQVESPIRYVLAPDRSAGATDESGGLVTVDDMLRDDGGETVGLMDADGGGAGGKDAGGKSSGWRGRSRFGSASGGSSGRERSWSRSRSSMDAATRDVEGDGEGGGKEGRGRREGCCGRWNTYSGNVVDKKDRERWWHQERGRWRGVVLS
ncbi:hypothetical protein VTJ83DRAFT_5994 [Remersonia thermophila]|uniref:F-box domain-containing protein n=1 Tax=Remersonia thermophila TaxID=72144 RepID=A0ABR4DAL8_9PEZI